MRVDAALLSEPFITQTEKSIGAIPLFDAASGPTSEISISGYGMTEEFAATHPNTVAAFKRAIVKRQKEAAADRRKVQTVLQDYASIDADTATW